MIVHRIEHPDTCKGPHSNYEAITWTRVADRFRGATPWSHPAPYQDRLPNPTYREHCALETPGLLRTWWAGLLLALDADGYQYVTRKTDPNLVHRGRSGQVLYRHDHSVVLTAERCKTLTNFELEPLR